MKKIYICLFIILSMLTGCTSGVQNSVGDSDKIQIVSTVFPSYDWMREILGDNIDNVELTYLLDNGVDLHSYQFTTDDMIKITNCDMLIYVGGESDTWIDDALKIATNEDMVVVNLVDALGDLAKDEVIKEGMEHDHEHDEEHNHDEESSFEGETDEHIWLSIRNAQYLCSYLAEKLGGIDPDNAEDYILNANNYNAKLANIDAQYADVVSEAKYNTVLFADRFPFRYMVDDYNLDYYAAFPGCSAEIRAGFETVIFLANKVDELGLESILVIETSDQALAGTVKDSTANKNQKILVMDSLQSINADDISNGVTYISKMEENLEILKEALN